MSYISDAIKKAEHDKKFYQPVVYKVKNTNNKSFFFWLGLILLILFSVIF
jgi:hypothetical protein